MRGWRHQDRYGQPQFAERQRVSVTRQGSRTVYTPQILVNGRDLRGLSLDAKLIEAARSSLQKPAQANLQLRAEINGNSLELAVTAGIADRDLRRHSSLYLAVTENNLNSKVSAGENRGVTLHHDHVVRAWLGPIALNVEGQLELRRNVNLDKDWRRGDLEVAALVQDESSGDILQAVAAPVCNTP